MASLETLGAIWIFEWYTLVMIAVLIALIIFLVMYRRRQM
jgi:hypothetical protein